MALEQLLGQRSDLWRGKRAFGTRQAVPSGFTALDSQLVGGGWPLGAVTELLIEEEAAGFWLLLPTLARLSREPRWIALISPPHLPYAPALAAAGIELSRLLLITPQAVGERQWALEQALRSGDCSAVLAWPSRLDMKALRRLQLAAEAGRAMAFLYRPAVAAREVSPAALRLQLHGSSEGEELFILKQRGGMAGVSLQLDARSADLPSFSTAR